MKRSIQDAAYVVKHANTCQNFDQSETRLVLESDQKRNQAKNSKFFVVSETQESSRFLLGKLHRLPLNWLILSQDRNAVHVWDSFPLP